MELLMQFYSPSCYFLSHRPLAPYSQTSIFAIISVDQKLKFPIHVHQSPSPFCFITLP
jgi:hypothetical protein